MLTAEQQERIHERARRIPIFDQIGIRIESLAPGECRALVPHDTRFDGIFNSFHGGMLMTVADTVASFALMSAIGTEDAMATTDMNIRFLAPCLSDVRAVARVIKAGKTLCPIQVDLYDTSDRHVAVAQVNFIRLGKQV